MNRTNLAVEEENEDYYINYEEFTANSKKKASKGKSKILKITYLFIKRIIDIIGAIIGIIFLIPVTIIIYIAKKIIKEDEGPLFYEQLRYGKNGKVFKLYKYRSMCINAEKKLKEYLEENEEARKEFDEYQKLKDDPRITKVGKFIRKTSIDELPQLFNILKGDMSIVGPRPALPREVKQYTVYQTQRLFITPGLTCYWQIQPNRNDIPFDEWVEMDLQYIRERSFLVDWKIIFKTVITVFTNQGR